MKEYCYNSKLFSRKVTVTGVFCILIGVYSLWRVIAAKELVWLAFFVAAGYTVWNSFVSISNPSKVILSDKEIVFCAYGREDHFVLSELQDFRVKDFPNARKMFVRVNHSNPLKGRYWIPAKFFNDTEELYQNIMDIELRMHPNSLKAMSREKK